MDDVIVVGGGPAGNNAALELARRGVSVTVLDWRQKLGDKLCTGIIGRECAARFPVDPALVYREARSATVFPPSQVGIRFETPASQASIIDRVGYVASLAEQARQAGARHILGQRVSQVRRDAQGVTVCLGGQELRARALVLAAGFNSPLNRQLGFGMTPDYVTGAQAVAAVCGVEETLVYLGSAVAPGFFAWVVPTAPGHALVGTLARRGALPWLERFIQRLEAEGAVKKARPPVTWAIPLRPLKRAYDDRVLVVGDAAGQVKPTTGGGIFYSLLASQLAADALAQALADNDLSAARLSQYQREWKALLGRELEAGYAARRLYEFLSDQQINALAQQVSGNSSLKAELLNPDDLSFDWHSGMISKVLGNPALGTALRMVNPLLARFAHRPEAAPDWEEGWDDEKLFSPLDKVKERVSRS